MIQYTYVHPTDFSTHYTHTSIVCMIIENDQEKGMQKAKKVT